MAVNHPDVVAELWARRWNWHFYRQAVWRQVVENRSSELVGGGKSLSILFADPDTDPSDRTAGIRAVDYDTNTTGGLDALTYPAMTSSKVDLLLNKEKVVTFTVEDIDQQQVGPSLIEAGARQAALSAALQVNDDIRAEFDVATTPDSVGAVISTGASFGTITTPTEASAKVIAERLLDASIEADKRYWPEGMRYMFLHPDTKKSLVLYLINENVFTTPSAFNDPALRDATIGKFFGFMPMIDPKIPTTGTEAYSIYLGVQNDGLAFAEQISMTENLRSIDRVATLFRRLMVYGAVKNDLKKFLKIRFDAN